MADLLEVVLEDVPCSKLYLLLMELLGAAGKIDEIQSDFKTLANSTLTAISCNEIEDFIKLPDDAVLVVKISGFNIADVAIPVVMMRVVKYGDKFDIDFNFSESDVKNISAAQLMKKIHIYTSEICKEYQVGSCFGGMEPANDEDTRYFTGCEIGPLG